jgi:polyvinyl alcohol dehydrogenase (cytochrome)
MKKDWLFSLFAAVAFLTILFASCAPLVSSFAREEAALITRSTTRVDWPSYMLGNDRANFNQTETRINPVTVSHLTLRWVVQGSARVFSQPLVVNGLIYWGSGDGFEHATDLHGKQVWMVNLGTSHAECDADADDKVGIIDTAAVSSIMIGGKRTSVLFVGGGDGRFYALNAMTGAIIWTQLLGIPPATFLWSSPAIYDGKVYEGVSSLADCPLVQGKLVQMDASTGAITHTFNTVPKGCQGGSIWSSPTIDTTAGIIYVSTGNPGPCSVAEPYAPGIVKLRASDLSFLDSWQVPQNDQIGDSDFGATPTLFTATIARVKKQLVGMVNKNGLYYAFDRNAIGHGPIWAVQAGGVNNVAPSTWDGRYLYLGGRETTLQGKKCAGTFEAVNPATGAFLWQRCLSDGSDVGAITIVPGVATVPEGGAFLAIATNDGHTLFSYSNNHARFLGPASISNGMLYIGSYTGGLYAFGF